jgi:2'-5' RNA ligase
MAPTRLFVAAAIPEHARAALRDTLSAVAPAIDHRVPEERWHLTVLFIGPAEADEAAAVFTGSAAELFTPTVHLTHLGAGRQPEQLWAYAEPTALLERLRAAVIARAAAAGLVVPAADSRSFVPHVRLADLAPKQAALLPVVPLSISFPLRELTLFASVPDGADRHYEPRGRLDLVS